MLRESHAATALAQLARPEIGASQEGRDVFGSEAHGCGLGYHLVLGEVASVDRWL